MVCYGNKCNNDFCLNICKDSLFEIFSNKYLKYFEILSNKNSI